MTAGPGIQHDNNYNMIRLVAALQVLAVHVVNHFGLTAPLLNALRITPGVPTFFFVSGVLIYGSYTRLRDAGRSGFFRNRVLRIYPGLLVCLVVSLASVYVSGYFASHPVGWRPLGAWLLAQATMFQFYNPDFLRGYGAGVLNGAVWTVAVEIQFYLLVPALWYLLRRQRLLLAALLLTSLAVNLYLRNFLDWNLLQMKLLYVSFLPWVYMFLTGFIVASSEAAQRQVRRIPIKYLVVAYILSMNLVGSYTVNAANSINPVSFVILGALILRLAEYPLRLPTTWQRFVARNDFSYGLYLYHMPTINFLLALGVFSLSGNVVVAVLASAVLAVASWYLVERPALSRKR